jgi:5-methyltetrahydrofolate--homocysteine methyltransferase
LNPTNYDLDRRAPGRPGPMTSNGRDADRFLAALDRGPLVLDAGLGTRLCALGLDLRTDDPALWNLTHPAEVLDQHVRDVKAGSQVLFSNTFGANRSWLARYGRADSVEAINRAAVELARAAFGAGGFVAGDIGPSAAEQPGAAAEQAAMLVDSGIDVLVFETFLAESLMDVLREVLAALDTPVPILASLWKWPEEPEATARRLEDLGVTVVGINCQPGMDAAIALAGRLHGAISCPLLVKPSASGEGTTEWSSTPAAFAAAVPQLLEWDVRLFGGCCGTTESHVEALARACAPHQNQNRLERTGVRP